MPILKTISIMKTTMSMENKYHIIELWSSLKSLAIIGVVKKLYDASLPIQVYATYSYPDDIVGIAVSFSKEFKIDISSLSNLSELRIRQLLDASMPGQKMLHVQLMRNENQRVFAALCEDLITTLKPLSSTKEMAQEVVNQLHRWKDLFGKIKFEGLSKEEQQGLYGELVFLRKLLNRSSNDTYVSTLQLWTGVEKTNKDFQGDNWAVEVKTTSTNNAQFITINGERQLDNSLVAHLFVYHLVLEVSKTNGESLPMIVSEIKALLSGNVPALCIFEEKLIEAKYISCHEFLYAERFYKKRSEKYYKVLADFPRIMENDLRNGVSNVVYVISIGMCDEHLVPEGVLFNTIK